MVLQKIQEATIEGAASTVEKLTHQALDSGIKPHDTISKALIPGMDKVGVLYEQQEYFLPELIAAANAMQGALKILRPLLKQGDNKGAGRVVIGTVEGDLHDMGKNLVITMLEGAGYDVIDLGVDVPSEGFVAAVKEHQPQVVGMSALLTTTMPLFEVIIRDLAAAGLRGKAKIIIGGAGVNQHVADQYGADGYAPDASAAVRKVRELVNAMESDQ